MASYPLSFPEEAAPFPHGTTLNVSAEPLARTASMIGRTGELLSGGLQQASQSIFEYEERARNIQNTINNNNATTQFAKQGLDITQGFLALKGDDALRAQDDYRKKLDDLGESMLADPNLTPKQRAMLSSSITSLGDRYRYRMADHAATQQDFSWKKSIMEAGDQAALSARETSVWGTPQQMEFDLQAGINAIRQPGLGATDSDVRDYIGKTVKHVVDYQIYLNNPDKAQQILDYYRKRMDPASVNAAERAIEVQLNEHQGTQEGQQIFQQGMTHVQGLNSAAASVNLSATSALGGEGIDLNKAITVRAGNSVTYSLKDFDPAQRTKILDHFAGDSRILKGGIHYDPKTESLQVTVGRPRSAAAAMSPLVPEFVALTQWRGTGTTTPPTEGYSEYLRAERQPIADAIGRDPDLVLRIAAVAATENAADPIGPLEALANRWAYAKKPIEQMLTPTFYGPMRTGVYDRELARLRANPGEAVKYTPYVYQVLLGSNVLGGATDQGSPNDPNAGHRGGKVIRVDEVYNDWGGGPGGHEGARRYREEQQYAVRRELAGKGNALTDAREAIASGAPRDAVIGRLKSLGVDTTGL